MNTLPTPQQISNWSDEFLLSVIESGEKINWDLSLSDDEIECYIASVLNEKEKRAI